MTLPLIMAFVWLIVANVIAMLPSRDHHWRNAYALIVVGILLEEFRMVLQVTGDVF